VNLNGNAKETEFLGETRFLTAQMIRNSRERKYKFLLFLLLKLFLLKEKFAKRKGCF